MATATGGGGLVLGTHTAEKANWHRSPAVVSDADESLIAFADDLCEIEGDEHYIDLESKPDTGLVLFP